MTVTSSPIPAPLRGPPALRPTPVPGGGPGSTRRMLARLGDGAARAGVAVVRFAVSPFFVLVLVSIPVLAASGLVVAQPFLLLWLFLTIFQAVAALYHRGLQLQKLEGRLTYSSVRLSRVIRAVTPGALGEGAPLPEAVVHAQCARLLATIREYTELALEPATQERLRCTLALPIRDPSTGQVTHMRVWCYDRRHADQQYSAIPAELPGSPVAFRNNSVEIIADLRALSPLLPDHLRRRRYRSVLSIPVTVGHDPPRPVGVVSIDAPSARYFTPVDALRILPLVAPALDMIGLVLLRLDPHDELRFDRPAGQELAYNYGRRPDALPRPTISGAATQ